MGGGSIRHGAFIRGERVRAAQQGLVFRVLRLKQGV